MARRAYYSTVDRRTVLLAAAAEVARRDGMLHLTMDSVAIRARCSRTTVWRHLGDRKSLRASLIEYAKARGYHDILAEASTLAVG